MLARPSAVRRSPCAASRFSERIVRVWFASSKAVRSSASRAFRISSRNLNFGEYFGWAGSKPDGPFSMAYMRSNGMVWPADSSIRASGSGESPFTG